MIIVYGTTNCAFCKVEKQWLDSKGVEYIWKNIEESEIAREHANDLGITSFPTTILSNEDYFITVRGFDRPKLTESIEKILGR